MYKAVSSVLPVLCLEGAGQVFGVWVTEGVGQTILVADFLAVGFGLWGAAFTLKKVTQQENTNDFFIFPNCKQSKANMSCISLGFLQYLAVGFAQFHTPFVNMCRQKVWLSSSATTTCREVTDHNLAVVCHASLSLPVLRCHPVWWFMKSNCCLPLPTFLGCCSSSALQCPRPSELAGTHSYGPDHDASASASTGQCLWEESCWKGAVGMTVPQEGREEPRKSHEEKKSKLTWFFFQLRHQSISYEIHLASKIFQNRSTRISPFNCLKIGETNNLPEAEPDVCCNKTFWTKWP